MTPTDGPNLSTYVETRFNLLDEKIETMFTQLREAIDERDRRYEERHQASQSALEKVAEEMKSKFANTNEWRSALEDLQRLQMPRAEAESRIDGLERKLESINAGLESKLNQQFTIIDRLQTERQGIRGGYGYAVGIVGFVMTVITIGMLVLRSFGQ